MAKESDPKSENPDQATFQPEDLEDRFIALDLTCRDFAADLEVGLPSGHQVGVDRAVLYDVLVSAYYDIMRYKSWHQTDPSVEKSDSIKRAAFFTKWLVRLKPIWVSRPEYKPTRKDCTVLVNERFALEWAFANLSFELGKKCPSPTERKFYELLYDIHFRDISSDALISIFQLYYDIVAGLRVYNDLDRT